MQSVDKVQANIEKIRKMFPNAVTEIKRDGKVELAVDFDVLKQELADTLIDERELRYQFTWPDKQKAVLLANMPVAATLRPCKEESVDFDSTQNLYIDGDNLDVLKLLQETYLGKIKMIYIDPPYNTGNDFVYNDDFAQDSDEYVENSGQYDDQGNRLVPNPESNGRFHTDWLNMIYPRLRLAKDLLSDDGVIFISIDDNEVENLRKICNEIYGESNFIASIIWKRKRGRDNSARWFSKSHEYLIVYAKNKEFFDTNFLELDEETKQAYKNPDNDPRGDYRMLGCWARGTQGGVRYDFTAKNGQYFTERLWLFSKENLRKLDEENKLVFHGDNVYRKMFLFENKGKIPETLWDNVSNAANASDEIKKLFENIVFDTPKPIPYVKEMLKIATDKNSIILDFFSGSATTAHAVMQLNAEDGGKRKFIMVQLPEPCDEKSEAYKAGYKSICEIGKERIRRAGRKIKQQDTRRDLYIDRIAECVKVSALKNSLWSYTHDVEKKWCDDENATDVQEEFVRSKIIELINEETPSEMDGTLYENYENQIGETVTRLTQLVTGLTYDVDIGFRVLKLDSSNMKDVYYKPEDYSQTLLDGMEDNIKSDRTPLDLLFQVMLDLGKPLSAKIEEKEIAGKNVFIVDGNDLIACFDTDITDEVVKTIAQLKPLYAVFRDSSLADDSTAANFDQIFATYSPTTIRKVL